MTPHPRFCDPSHPGRRLGWIEGPELAALTGDMDAAPRRPVQPATIPEESEAPSWAIIGAVAALWLVSGVVLLWLMSVAERV